MVLSGLAKYTLQFKKKYRKKRDKNGKKKRHFLRVKIPTIPDSCKHMYFTYFTMNQKSVHVQKAVKEDLKNIYIFFFLAYVISPDALQKQVAWAVHSFNVLLLLWSTA